ncbi:MAG: ATP phosphoribosyltransferase [Proteobacteria bacterium]|nr:ATP phosphoribosyltransferase [Pseudomonadota bacterium]
MSLRLTIQKSGRLTQKTLSLLTKSGFDIDVSSKRYRYIFHDLPLEVLLLRDDDIPSFVEQGACDMGIVGLNTVLEHKEQRQATHKNYDTQSITVALKLGFSRCRLSLAIDKHTDYPGIQWFKNKKIATSYPALLKKHLQAHNITAHIHTISGSVESAPSMNLAHGICDLVATGSALQRHQLKEVDTLLESEAVMIYSPKHLSQDKKKIFDIFSTRLQSVIKAERSKYIMMNAPGSAIEAITRIIPGLEQPTVIPLNQSSAQPDQVAIHAVASEPVFWSTIEELKGAGARSILVVPIEKIVD